MKSGVGGANGGGATALPQSHLPALLSGVLVALAAAACGKSQPAPAEPTDASAQEASAPQDAAGDKTGPSLDQEAPEAAADSSGTATSDKPVWVDMEGSASVCKMQRLANPDKVQVIHWRPCDGVADCETAEYDGNVVSSKGFATPRSVVGYLDGQVRAGLVIVEPSGPHASVLFTDGDGRAFDGYRSDPGSKCATSNPALWGPRYGVVSGLSSDQPGPGKCGGVLASAGAPPALFTLPDTAIGAPGQVTLGDSHWVWTWALPSYTSSISSLDGSGFQVIHKNLVVHGVVTSGTHFFLGNDVTVDGKTVEGILITDGKSPAQPFLTPPTGESYGAPGYAHTHLLWMRGINPKMGLYDKIEVWASPYTADPVALNPEKIADWPHNWIPLTEYSAGYGKLASAVPVTEDVYNEVIVDAVTKQTRTISFPVGNYPAGGIGMTKSHAWVVAGGRYGTRRWLLRFKLE